MSRITSMHCPSCGKQTAATEQTPNHVLHLLVSLFFCGAWLPVWLMCAVLPGAIRCNVCGTEGKRDHTTTWIVLGLGGAVMGLYLMCLVATFIAMAIEPSVSPN